MSKGIEQGGIIPDPSKNLTVIIEPSEGFMGGQVTFDVPFEPIVSYVGQTVMAHSNVRYIIHKSNQPAPFDIISWNPSKCELRVRLHKGAFGTK